MHSTELKSRTLLKEVMKDYFHSFSDGNKKVAWCTSVGPAELLRSFGFEIYFPENHGALLGATRTATDFIAEAGKKGFSNHICSYTTSDIGAYLSGSTPLQKHYGLSSIPRPDVIVYNTNQCREVEDWFSFYGRQYNCPVLGIHPPRHLDVVTKDEVGLVVRQLKSHIPELERISGNKFDEDKFRDTIRLSLEATILWQQVLNTAKTSPSFINFFDGTIHMGPIVILRGTASAKNYYSELLNEIKQLQKNSTANNNPDEIRLFWDGMPIWGKIRMLSDLFHLKNASVVASTYCNSWIFDAFNENDPFQSMALAYTSIFINRSEKAKLTMLKQWLQDFNCDGIVFHDSKTCFNNSNAKFGLPLRLKEEIGIPFLVIEGDFCDLRFFSEEQSITKIETFIEQLENLNSRIRV